MFLNPRSKRRRYGIEQWHSGDGWVSGSTFEVGVDFNDGISSLNSLYSRTEPQAVPLKPVLNKPFNSGWTSTEVPPMGFEPKSTNGFEPAPQLNSLPLTAGGGTKRQRPLPPFQ